MKRDGRETSYEFIVPVAGELDPGDPVSPVSGAKGRKERKMEPLEGQTDLASTKSRVSTKLRRIAQMARNSPQMVFKTLAHHVDLDMLRVAYHKTRKDGATGLDGITGKEYGRDLEANLQSLWGRLKKWSLPGTFGPAGRNTQRPKRQGQTTNWDTNL